MIEGYGSLSRLAFCRPVYCLRVACTEEPEADSGLQYNVARAAEEGRCRRVEDFHVSCVLHDRGTPRSVSLLAGVGWHARADSLAAKCRVDTHAGSILYTDCRAALRSLAVTAGRMAFAI